MTAKYLKLAKILREQINSNTGRGSGRLPSEKELCVKYGVSRQTVRQALDLLCEEQLIVRRRGSGTYLNTDLSSSVKSYIAVLVSTSTEYIYPSLLKDLGSALNESGYETRVYVTDDRADSERHILKELLKSKPAGIIAEPSHSSLPTPNADIYEQFSDHNIPVVFLRGGYTNLKDFIYVRSDDVYGGYMAAKYLTGKNHKNICCLLKGDDISGIDRYTGITGVLCDMGIDPIDENFFWYSSSDLDALRQGVSNGFLNEFTHSRIPGNTAVICQSDEIAYFLIKEMNAAGIKVPSDCSIISFDNSYLRDFGSVKLTSLTHNQHELGRTAAKTVLKLIKKQGAQSVRLTWHLVSGSSDSYLNDSGLML